MTTGSSSRLLLLGALLLVLVLLSLPTSVSAPGSLGVRVPAPAAHEPGSAGARPVPVGVRASETARTPDPSAGMDNDRAGPWPGGPDPGAGPADAMGVANVSTGRTPFPSLYDGSDGQVYVVNTASQDVSIVQDARVVVSVNIGGNGSFPAYDPSNGYVYVPDPQGGNVSVLDGSQLIASVPVGMAPRFAAYDPQDGYVYVSDYYEDEVSILSGTRFVTVLYVESGPLFEAYDSRNGYLYVENAASNDVSILEGTTVLGTVDVGGFPHQAAVDPSNGFLYVPNFNSNTVSILNGTARIATVDVGNEPTDATFDSESGDVYVTNYESNTVSVLNGTRLIATVNVGEGPMYAAYDPQINYLFVPNDRSDNVSVLRDASVVATVSVGSLPEAATYDPANGYVYVSDSGSGGVSVIAAPHGYTVTFSETGLPRGTPWFVVLNGTLLTSTSTTLAFAEPNGTYTYVVSSAGGSAPSPVSGSVTVDQAPRGVALAFALQSPFSVTFAELGLPKGTNWSVTLGDALQASTGTTINFSEPSGAVPYRLGVVAGWMTTTYAGMIEVNGSAVSQLSIWNPVTYPVTFRENGLPGPEDWWVQITAPPDGPGAVGAAQILSLFLPNGTYAYSVFSLVERYSSPGGTFALSGNPLSLPVPFLPSPYTVTFQETGLPTGTQWAATLGGDTLFSTNTSIAFNEPNGTPAYVIGILPGWSTPVYSGQIAVNGAPVTRLVRWVQVNYSVTFYERGLPAGTEWWVDVAPGPLAVSTTSELAVDEPNGTHTYLSGTTDTDYEAPPGNFSLNGSVFFVEVVFSPITYLVVVSETGLPSGTPWAVTIGNTTRSGTAAFTTVELGNGTYPFTVDAPPGYTASPSEGRLSVHGGTTSQMVAFAPVPATFLGLPTSEGQAVLGGGIAALAAVGTIVAVLIGRRPKRRQIGPRARR